MQNIRPEVLSNGDVMPLAAAYTGSGEYEYIYYVAILHFDGQIFIALLYENLGHSLSDARIVLFCRM